MQHRISLSTVTLLAIAASKATMKKQQKGKIQQEQERETGNCVVNADGLFIDFEVDENCYC